MVHKIFNINDITKDMVAHYLPLISQQKREKILSMNDAFLASQTLVSEMLARQCLSLLCDAPESSFQLLIKPDAKSAVTNFNAKISVCTCGEFVACCASHNNIGISLVRPDHFTFADFQKNCSDSEIRHILSDSKQTLTDVIRTGNCTDASAIKEYAKLLSLKKAQFSASGKVILSNISKINFSFEDNTAHCLDNNYKVSAFEFYDCYNLACSIIERCIS